MILPRDWREFLESLNARHVEFMIVGAHALAFHGVPRATSDLDIFIRVSPENASNVCAALSDFGLGTLGHTKEDFLNPEMVVQLGVEPMRIDILCSIEAVSFDDAWRDRVRTQWNGIDVSVIGREHLLINKRATGRLQDLADADRLGEK